MRTGVVDMPRYDKYIVGKKHLRLADGEYVDRRRYKDSIYFKSINKVVMHIDIPLIQLINQGVNITTFRTLLVKQFNQATKHIECPVCQANLNSQKVRKVIDHNHTTGKVRGVLCSTCNTGIGLFKENQAYMSQAISYLENPPLINRALNYKTISNQTKSSKQAKEAIRKEFPYCLICGKDKSANKNRDLALDHSHSSFQVRGILCSNCNLGLGLLNDSIKSLNGAITYLNKNNA